MAQAAAGPLHKIDGVFAAALRRPLLRRLSRDIRFTVPVCIVLICGSFAAATILQMRLDHTHALAEAARFEFARSRDIAQASGQSLDRFARLGRIYADNPQQYRSAGLGEAEPAIRDIAVFGEGGQLVSRLQAQNDTPPVIPHFSGARHLYSGGLEERDTSNSSARVIAVLFDPRSVVPKLKNAMLLPLGRTLQPGDIAAPVPGWPLMAVTRVDEASALASWRGALPLYLFVILGPALVGGWLAALFVGAYERQGKARAAIRALKSTRPIEAKLMVRLANAERGAVEALRSKSEFIAHMSHELRTPLNAVIGFSEIIAEGFFGPTGHPKYSEYARDIGDAGRNLHAKVGDILEFSNIEAGRHPLTSEAVDLATLASACLEEHQGCAFSRRIALRMTFAEPGMVRADASALRRVLSNLLGNALTYTAEGGSVRAEVRFEEGAGLLILSDSGIGFSDAERGKAGGAFERFDRAGTVTGAGLGLAIAMELTRRMGGAMRLASRPGDGARMELRLPRL
jgi:signal transduction histidine kinase